MSVENSLVKKVKIENEFEGEQKNIEKTYTQRVKERIGEYHEEKTFKIYEKRKKDKYGEILEVINKNNENVTRKNPTKTQTMTVESSKAKTTINHPKQRKKLHEQ